MHFASRITLSGIALSGVAMISFRTFAELSMRLVMSAWSSAAQPVPRNIEQMPRAARHLVKVTEIRLIVVLSVHGAHKQGTYVDCVHQTKQRMGVLLSGT